MCFCTSCLLPAHRSKTEHQDTAGDRINNKEMKNAGLSLQCTRKDISLINGTCSVHFLVSQLEVNVGMPRLLLWLPLHPTFKHLA